MVTPPGFVNVLEISGQYLTSYKVEYLCLRMTKDERNL
jgi:hypothetical protein